MRTELAIAIARGPECPACGEDRFDDWHRDPRLKGGDGIVVRLRGALRCHGCGKNFAITQYTDGETHSTMRRRARN